MRGSVQAAQSPRTPSHAPPLHHLLQGRMQELLRVSEWRSRGGAGRRSQSGAAAVSGHTDRLTGWLRAVARAARRFCLPRQGGLEPAALSWATSSARLATTTPAHSVPGSSETSAGKTIRTESVGAHASRDGDQLLVTTVPNKDGAGGLRLLRQGNPGGHSPLRGPCPSTDSPAAAGDPGAWIGGLGRVRKKVMEGLQLSREQQGEAALLPGGSPGFSQHLAQPAGRVKNNCSERERSKPGEARRRAALRGQCAGKQDVGHAEACLGG